MQEGRTSAMAMDITHDESMNMLTDVGFVSTLYHAACVKVGGGFLAAPVCSSFVYMSLVVDFVPSKLLFSNRPLQNKRTYKLTANYKRRVSH